MTTYRLRARTKDFRDAMITQWRHDPLHIDTADRT